VHDFAIGPYSARLSAELTTTELASFTAYAMEASTTMPPCALQLAAPTVPSTAVVTYAGVLVRARLSPPPLRPWARLFVLARGCRCRAGADDDEASVVLTLTGLADVDTTYQATVFSNTSEGVWILFPTVAFTTLPGTASKRNGLGFHGVAETISFFFAWRLNPVAGCEYLPPDSFCELLPFPGVVYNDSVRDALLANASAEYTAFQQALSQFNCEKIQYSFVRNCTDCLNAYKYWVRASAMLRGRHDLSCWG